METREPGTGVWDALVVGAGPAGCAAAYDLAAAGARVLLVDRALFPRPKACAGGLTAKAIRALRYSIDPVVRRWVRSITLEEQGGRTVALARRGSPVCAMTVREELDRYCLEQTTARGAVFERIGAIEAIVQSADGVELRTADAAPLRARFLVGADGVHSRVRALTTDSAWFRTAFAIEANVPYREPGEQYPLTFDFDPVQRGYGWLFPRDTHVNVGLYVDGSAERLDRGRLAAYIARRCGANRAHGAAVGQFLGLGAAGYCPADETRVLLAGDAAGFVDPLTGEGIYGAIRSGQAAAHAILRTMGGDKPAGGLGPGFVRAAAALQRDLAVAEYAARRFYADPASGFRILGAAPLRRAALYAYSNGASLGALLSAVRLGRRLRLYGR